MIAIDTNVLVRYLAQDDAAQAAAATQFIEHRLSVERPGFVSSIVLAELCWVLHKAYRVGARELAEVLSDLLSTPVFRFESRDAALAALERFRSHGGDYPDALIRAIGAQCGCKITYTFDRVAARASGMSLLVP
ncbi:MAG: type II toxin-antitoxin system VapC family toxin [Burkholderiaceae bacterium]